MVADVPLGVISLILHCGDANDAQVHLDLTARSGSIQAAKIGYDIPTDCNDKAQIAAFQDSLVGLKLHEVRDFTLLFSRTKMGMPKDLYALLRFLNAVFGIYIK